MFTATLDAGVEALALRALERPVRIFVGARGAAAPTVAQRLLFVGREGGKLLALRQMVAAGVRTPCLVFVQSRARGEQVFAALAADGLAAELLHADRSAAQRAAAVARFRRGAAAFLVATDLVARGLDFAGVATVVNFDFPTSGVQYVHRVGRAGRAGRRGEAVTLFVEDDLALLRTVANVMRVTGCAVPEWMLSVRRAPRGERARLRTRAPKRKKVGAGPAPAGAAQRDELTARLR